MLEIRLRNGHICLLDEEDLPLFKAFKWFALANKKHTNYYVASTVFGGILYLHRLILNAPKGLVVDHINHNGLDNRRKNIRLCTAAENIRNSRPHARKTSCQYKGVWQTRTGGWEARICYGSKQRYIGTFKTPIEAAKAYDNYAKTFHGMYAKLNFPEVSA